MPIHHAGVPARKPSTAKLAPRSSTPSAAAAEEALRPPEKAQKPSGITAPAAAPTIKHPPGPVPTEAEHEARALAAKHPNPEVKA